MSTLSPHAKMLRLFRLSWILLAVGYGLLLLGGVLTVLVAFQHSGEPFLAPNWLRLQLGIAMLVTLAGTASIILYSILALFLGSDLPFLPASLVRFQSPPDPPSPAPGAVEAKYRAGFWIAVLIIVVFILLAH